MSTVPSESAHPAETVATYAWVILFAIFIASVAAPINQFKVPPVMPALIGQFGLSMTQAGLLMSVFSFAGLILAFPAGMVLSSLGQRKTCLLALAIIVGGSLWGTWSAADAELLVSRTLEGAGMAILGVTAPVVIATWFPPSRRGIALGVWSAWVSTGVIVMMNASPMVTPDGQWTQTWWLGTGIAAAALVLFAVLYRNPPVSGDVVDGGGPPMREMFSEVLARRDVWLLAISLFSFNIMVLALNTFFPTYLSKVHGLPMQEADFFSSIANMVMLFSCPLGGWLADKTGTKKPIFSVCLALIALWWLVVFRVPVAAIPLFMGIFGLLGGPIITTIITALPDAVGRPALLGFGMSLLMFWHHLGEFVGPVYFGRVLDLSGSWQTAAAAMVPVCIIGGIAGMMMKTR